MQRSLTRTLVCQLDIDEGSPRLLTQGQREARRVVNEVFRLDREGYDWDHIEDLVTDRSSHVKNTTQRLVEKAIDALERYYDEDDYGHPRQNHEDEFPLRKNHGEGYALRVVGNMTKVYNQIRTNCARNANVRVPTPVKKIELPTTVNTE